MALFAPAEWTGTAGSDCQSGVCTGGVCQAPTCGDGLCDPNCFEDPFSCPIDCGSVCLCGDGFCDSSPGCGESVFNCQSDCAAQCACGNFLCEPQCGESTFSCPADCNGSCVCGDGTCAVGSVEVVVLGRTLRRVSVYQCNYVDIELCNADNC